MSRVHADNLRGVCPLLCQRVSMPIWPASLRQRREAIVNQHADAENRHDIEATIATFHHPRYEFNGDPSDGEAAVRELLRGMMNGLSDLHAEIGKVRHADDAVIIEGLITANPPPRRSNTHGHRPRCRQAIPRRQKRRGRAAKPIHQEAGSRA
jgi:SnoaL-like domain